MATKKINREIFLTLILIFKIVPKQFFLSVSKVFLDTNKKQIYSLLASLKLEKFIAEKETAGEKNLILTRKGFDRIENEKIKRQNIFLPKPKQNQGDNSTHNKYIFYFLLEFLKNQNIKNIETINLKKVFEYEHNKELKPDLFLQTNQNNIVLESDTGTENNKDIFDKFLRYFLLAKNNFCHENFDSLQIFFTCNSQDRLTQLFTFTPTKKASSFLKYFDSEKLEFQRDKKANKTSQKIFVDEVLEILETQKLTLFVGVFDCEFHHYKEINLQHLIKQSRLVKPEPKQQPTSRLIYNTSHTPTNTQNTYRPTSPTYNRPAPQKTALTDEQKRRLAELED
jgi:hypothetical protein